MQKIAAVFAAAVSVSKKSTRSWTGMPLARKSKIFGLHSLLLRYPKKISLGARIFFDRGAITPSFYPPQAAVGRYAPWVLTPVLLKNRLLGGFSLTRCFSAARVSGKTEMRRKRRREIYFQVYRQTKQPRFYAAAVRFFYLFSFRKLCNLTLYT